MSKHTRIKALVWGWSLAIATTISPAVRADDPKGGPPSVTPTQPYAPRIAPASDEPIRAMRSFRVPAGLTVELFASEPLLANPVAFAVDEKGVFYVAETFRHSDGVTDTRNHMNWLDDDLASRTVADRVAMYKKYLGAGFARYNVEHERVRRIVDRDGDGRADASTVFADGFNDPAAGIGAGLLARKGDVWYACIPWLWKLRDTDGDGRADRRTILHEGYGLHVGFLGHDLHGLKMGPDGKLYFSIGDRGFNVTTIDGRKLSVPDTGSVLRCNPDGTELEVFATGLRNPQELAFDEFGNLFTGDNNSDSGDRARWVYLLEGGDSGWRIGYQFIAGPVSRGPWNEEKLWYPAFDGQAAYIVPPIANLADGPSGLAYDPGVSLLPEAYKKHFFLVDFRGSSGQSGIRSFALRPRGASFELVDSKQFVWSVLATDADFGPDGALYFCDWVEGWDKPNKGRLYRVLDTSRRGDPKIREVQAMLAEGMSHRSTDELARLLAHPDMRVRQEAQFELATRGEAGSRAFAQVAGSKENLLARIHAIWGLGQVARIKAPGQSFSPWGLLGPMLGDPEAEVRAQAARALGDIREAKALAGLIARLDDPSPRVILFAAMALGKLGRSEAVGPLLETLRRNADKDPYLRHGAVMGLVGSGDVSALKRASADASPSVRMGVLLALRRLGDADVARFLKDSDPRLVLEAARAINDEPIAAAFASLAALPIAKDTPLPLLRRVLNANLRAGGAAQAAAVVEVAGRSDLPAPVRVQALEMLGSWAAPSGRDAVVGLWRPIAPRTAGPVADALRPRLASILGGAPDSVRAAAVLAAAALGIKDVGDALVAMATDRNQTDRSRSAALKALDQLGDPRRVEAARRAGSMSGARTRTEALRILAAADPDAAIPIIQERIDKGPMAERQGAIAAMASMQGDAARQAMLRRLDDLVAGKVPADLHLDLLEAAAARNDPAIRRKLQEFEASRPKGDPMAAYREVLVGGNAQRGRSVFTDKAATECLRCHKARTWNGEIPGGEVGPELSGIGARKDRKYILESIVEPNKEIAQGFETIVLATADGQVITGVFRGEDDKEVRLITAEGKPVAVPKDSIEDRKRGPSAMPADLAPKLSKTELRDLVEFLAGLKTPPRKP
ncbi:MAG: PVC-type heme-binding CxxCH protein [Isosphaeraceae bacterium]